MGIKIIVKYVGVSTRCHCADRSLAVGFAASDGMSPADNPAPRCLVRVAIQVSDYVACQLANGRDTELLAPMHDVERSL